MTKDCTTCLSRNEVEKFALNLIEIVEIYLDSEVRQELGAYLEVFADDLNMESLMEKVEDLRVL